MTVDYKGKYHQYPVYSDDALYEPSIKRFLPLPSIQEVFNMALFGIPKKAPLTGEEITPEMVDPYLASAIAEIEMSTGMNLSPATHYHPEDIIDGMFQNNYMGIKLHRWPATEITAMKIKFPHANSDGVYQTYLIPAPWVYLKKNKINVVAAMGSVTVSTDNQGLVSAGGVFQYITGFARGAYQPGVVEVVYKAGFDSDKLPANVSELVKVWAAIRFLTDMTPILFPNASVSNTIDGVTQSVSLNIANLLMQRIELLEKRKSELLNGVNKQFGQSIKMTFLGS